MGRKIICGTAAAALRPRGRPEIATKAFAERRVKQTSPPPRCGDGERKKKKKRKKKTKHEANGDRQVETFPRFTAARHGKQSTLGEHFTSGPNQRAYACTLHNSLTPAMKIIGRKRGGKKKEKRSKGAAAHASSLITSFLYDRITATSEILNYPLPYYTITPGDRLAY